MNQKNLSVKNKTHKFEKNYLKDKKIFQIFKKFQKNLKIKDKFAVAVSGGADSLSLAFLAKYYSLKYNIKSEYYIVDHKLRPESSKEAILVKSYLKKIGIDCKILKWNGKKPKKKLQSIARNKRYLLLTQECKKNKIKNLLIGHHLDDLFENFFLRILRGSGLNGLISLDKNVKYNDTNINILRPMLDFEKKDLIYISKKIFTFFVKDPSNNDENFKRIRVRNFLEKEGLDKKKFLLTINNLKDADNSIKFYIKRNIEKNTFFNNKKDSVILNNDFFYQSHEVLFRSLSEMIKMIGKKYYPSRGKSIEQLILMINSNSFKKVTLGGCLIEKANQSVLISKEN